MIERQAIGDPGAAVMTDDRKALVAKAGHQFDELSRHLPL